MDIFIDDWNMFHTDLLQAMKAMRDYLYNKEELDTENLRIDNGYLS